VTAVANDYIERLLAGDRRALARVVGWARDERPEGREALRLLYPRTGRAHTVGITGSAGSGKSTLTTAMAKEQRKRQRTVGIVAVDPSSAFTGGAILGDRIRMQELTGDAGVFMHSLASRGALGALSATTADVVSVLDASGKDIILIETVGAGQDEIEIARTAQTTLLVLTPNTGDDIQAMKAGIMEIADVLVVNKADLPNAEILFSQLKALLSYSEHRAWEIPIVRVVATKGEGIAELADRIEQHGAFLRDSGEGEARARDRARHQIADAVRAEISRRFLLGDGGERLTRLVEQVADRKLDPRSAADEIIAGSGAE
jgi:LAO/AO transport system kinase